MSKKVGVKGEINIQKSKVELGIPLRTLRLLNLDFGGGSFTAYTLLPIYSKTPE